MNRILIIIVILYVLFGIWMSLTLPQADVPMERDPIGKITGEAGVAQQPRQPSPCVPTTMKGQE